MASPKFSVVDLFAGPGGLGEGFSAFRHDDRQPFEIAVSIEKEESAARTLRFRAFTRLVKLKQGEREIDLTDLNPHSKRGLDEWLDRQTEAVQKLWNESLAEVWPVALGTTPGLERGIDAILTRAEGERIVIGGPPCQAYSLVGRARNRGIDGYVAEKDHRHFLYEEYIKVLRQVEPVAFVMENVKGILSAKVRKAGVFKEIERDLKRAGYVLCPLAPRFQSATALGDEGPSDPRDFLVRSEDFGIPQARHRVIIVGIRKERAAALLEQHKVSVQARLAKAFGATSEPLPIEAALHGLPALRSSLSRRGRSSTDEWVQVVRDFVVALSEDEEIRSAMSGFGPAHKEFLLELERVREALDALPTNEIPKPPRSKAAQELREWLTSNWSGPVKNHDPRSHMKDDLARYLFAAAWTKAVGTSPKQPDFPDSLRPNHKNWNSGKFADRFRTQAAGSPATTVTSHISKDGHYFIHPDPAQCRSLTVREAARIQTFPDDYIFLGNRTQQYVQVGNAVPPLLAERIAGALFEVLAQGSI